VSGLALTNKRALVTGAARGIGRAVAIELARHGADVVLTDLADATAELAAVAREVENLGVRTHVGQADLRDKASIGALVSEAEGRIGGLDILVNVAGVHLFPAPLLTISEADWDRVQSINVKGPLWTCQAVVPGMVRRGNGSVINVASDSAFDVIPDEGAYGISKIAVVRLTAYLAKELSGTGVRVNSLAPGWVRTRLTEPFRCEPEGFRQALEGVPLRRIAEPEEIANVAVFLASDLSSYVSGHCIVADGGRIAGNPA
jgi:NAD(P)-dependent dehydrogenase (short-subunit alcohol dehydrogenase family)